jgi:hypothetical protein
MSATDYSRMSTEELVRRFIDGALALSGFLHERLMKRDSQEMKIRSKEEQSTEEEVIAVAAELRRRKPMAELSQLFDHPRNEVRRWAGGQFSSVDPERASAAMSGSFEDLTATAVLALKKRAVQLPPPEPKLQEMSLDQLVARFEDAGIRRWATRFLADKSGGPEIENYNRITRESGTILRELKARDAVRALLPLLEHKNVAVRLLAATDCLPIAAERATAVLEAIAAGWDRDEAISARTVLDRWRRGVYGTSDI